jgi:hypothetical protein
MNVFQLSLAALLCLPAVSGAQAQSGGKSEWAYLNTQGKLTYKTLERGDRIMDFSHAGYMGGGVSIPSVAVKKSLQPVAGDNTGVIQQAIDEVSRMPLVKGFRGAVLLAPGVYPCERTISIQSSGVVLRGSGSGTVIEMTGKPHNCISVGGNVMVSPVGDLHMMADDYVASGVNSFRLKDAAGLAVGDTIQITRPVTPAWVSFMGMNKLTRDGRPQTWLNSDISIIRTIRSIEGQKVTVDLPLSDSYDAKYLSPPGVKVVKVATSGEISQAGIESLRIASPAKSVTINEGHHRAFSIRGVADGWARNIEVINTVNSISISNARRITLDAISIKHEVPTVGAAKPADLSGNGSQLLFNRCMIQGDNVFYFATGARVSGPIVLLNCVFEGNGWIQPHQRWATGVLVDGCKVPDGGIDFMNRGAMGSGHGWSVGWAVAWNCKAKSFLNQQPPGAANWVIGGTGEKQRRAIPFDTIPFLPEGIYDAYGTPVSPASLYLAQLQERLGKQALKNIGY